MAPRTHEAIATTAMGVLEQVRLRTHSPQDEEVLVWVNFASVVAFDTWITDSAYFVSSYPLPLGLNAAGIVAEVGPNVDTVQVGDRVRVLFSS
jgi:Zn-dependent alcohol dehydrogenase